ncbi:hypothetical protein ABEY50_08060 [Priestia megaterium]
MQQKEDKYANVDVTKVYEHTDLPDKIADFCNNCGGVKFKSSVGRDKFLRECTNCGMKKNN